MSVVGMVVNVAIPEEQITAPVLNAGLEAVTRLNEQLIKSGKAPDFNEQMDMGVKWKPEPPGQESFDHAGITAKRGWGDCDDLAPLHAASLRASGEDPGARAVVYQSGPHRWHAITAHSDGTYSDPSQTAGMGVRRGSRADGIPPAAVAAMARPRPSLNGDDAAPRPYIALCQDRNGWTGRTDVPLALKGIMLAVTRRDDTPAKALAGSLMGASILGACAGCAPGATGKSNDKLYALSGLLTGKSARAVANVVGVETTKAAIKTLAELCPAILEELKAHRAAVEKGYVPEPSDEAGHFSEWSPESVVGRRHHHRHKKGKRPAPPTGQQDDGGGDDGGGGDGDGGGGDDGSGGMSDSDAATLQGWARRHHHHKRGGRVAGAPFDRGALARANLGNFNWGIAFDRSVSLGTARARRRAAEVGFHLSDVLKPKLLVRDIKHPGQTIRDAARLAVHPQQLVREAMAVEHTVATSAVFQMAEGALQSAISLVPGIGQGIAGAMGAANAILEGGGLLMVALNAALAVIPIPPGLQQIARTVLDAVVKLAETRNFGEAAITAVKQQIPPGMMRQVFDTLMHVVMKHFTKKPTLAVVSHVPAPPTMPPGTPPTVQVLPIQTAAQMVNLSRVVTQRIAPHIPLMPNSPALAQAVLAPDAMIANRMRAWVFP